jgi:hypothetical protein
VKSLATNPTLTMPDGTTFEVVESDSESGGARMEFEITMAPTPSGRPATSIPAKKKAGRC